MKVANRVRIKLQRDLTFPAKYQNCFREKRLRDFPACFVLPRGMIDFFLALHRGPQVHTPGKVDRLQREGGRIGGECRLYCRAKHDASAKLSKVIPLGQLLRCHGPWEELVRHRGDASEWATVLPPSFLSPLCSAGGRSDRPRLLLKRRPDIESGCARAHASPSLASSASPAPPLRPARCEKNERRGERTYLSCKRGGSNPESFAAQEFGRREGWRRRRTKRNNISAQSVAFLPPPRSS